ncbi:MAG TPA: sensor histidine kinase [Euzebya sp.]|nr:sensor histidine kinase [Euzebya sp.]
MGRRSPSRRRSLAGQMLAMQIGIVLLIVLATGALLASAENASIREDYQGRMLTIARSLSTVPSVLEAYDGPDPSATLQPLAEVVRESAGATFVVFTDAQGVRLSHPNPANIGQPTSTDPSVPLSGREYVGTQEGTLGVSLRAKVPVFADDGSVIGAVSVGILESALSADLNTSVARMAMWLLAAAIPGVAAAALVTGLVRRRIYGLEPDEIAQLLQARQAMLHGIREGLVATDDQGAIALVNDEARRLLELGEGPVVGAAVEVLAGTGLEELLAATEVEEVHDRGVLVGERLLVANRTVARIDGRAVGMVLTLRDRTELFDALRALAGERSIAESLRAQAHEHANQLHVIAGLLDIGEVPQALAYIERNGGGGDLTSGRVSGRIQDATLAALLLAKGAYARERGVALAVDESTSVAADVGDDVLTVVANLIDNAIDAAAGGGHVEVCITEGPVGLLQVHVTDDGPGIPEELAEAVFDVGVTTKSSDGDGRGIGLALVKRIVARCGGEVSWLPRQPRGTRFTATIPYRWATPSADPADVVGSARAAVPADQTSRIGASLAVDGS